MNADELRHVLSGKRILFVEDDEWLSESVTEALREKGARQVIVKHTIESGLQAMLDSNGAYDILITGMMMPESEKDYVTISAYRREREKYLAEMLEAESPDAQKTYESTELRSAVYRVDHVIYSLMRPEGGIELIEKVIAEQGSPPAIPILFFSARSNPAVISKALIIAGKGNSDWLDKPATFESLALAAAELMSGRRKAIEEHRAQDTAFYEELSLVFSDAFQQPVLDFYINPGNASTKTITTVLDALSRYHVASGGLGLEYKIDGLYSFVRAEVTR